MSYSDMAESFQREYPKGVKLKLTKRVLSDRIQTMMRRKIREVVSMIVLRLLQVHVKALRLSNNRLGIFQLTRST
jgi:hypothetical protein